MLSCPRDLTNHHTCSPPRKQVSLSPSSIQFPKQFMGRIQTRGQPGSPGKEKPPSLGRLAPHTSSSIPAWLRIMVIYIDDLDALPGSLPHPAPQLWPTTEAVHNPGKHVTSSPPCFLTATSLMPAMGTGSWQMFVEWNELQALYQIIRRAGSCSQCACYCSHIQLMCRDGFDLRSNLMRQGSFDKWGN